MGRSRGHPRGLGVAFRPTLDPSRAGSMATLGPARPPTVHGEAALPPLRFGVGPNLGVAFGPTIPSAEWTSIRRRSSVRWRVPTRELAVCSGLGGRWRVPTRELAACSGLGAAGSGSITGIGFGLAGVPTRSVAAGPWSGLGGSGVVWPGRCRRRPAWLWRNAAWAGAVS
jgi:hypothetical protein